jgi:hypothetical protein
MKYLLLLLLCGFALGQSQPDPLLTHAIEGAKLLHSQMRDPDSFKLRRAWTVSLAKGDAKFGAVCYEYYSRNGYGGMNHGYADFAPHTKNDFVKDKFVLGNFLDSDEYPSYRCDGRHLKQFPIIKDVTAEVRQSLTDGMEAESK